MAANYHADEPPLASPHMPESDYDLGTLAGRLNHCIDQRREKISAVATRADISSAYLSMLISGARQSAGKQVIQRLATALGVRWQWLLQGDGPEQPASTAREFLPVTSVVNETFANFTERLASVIAGHLPVAIAVGIMGDLIAYAKSDKEHSEDWLDFLETFQIQIFKRFGKIDELMKTITTDKNTPNYEH